MTLSEWLTVLARLLIMAALLVTACTLGCYLLTRLLDALCGPVAGDEWQEDVTGDDGPTPLYSLPDVRKRGRL